MSLCCPKAFGLTLSSRDRARGVIQQSTMIYRGFPARWRQEVPHWVQTGSVFHIRIAVHREKQRTELTDDSIARFLLDSAKFYETNQRWYIPLFLLMPDHLHAL